MKIEITGVAAEYQYFVKESGAWQRKHEDYGTPQQWRESLARKLAQLAAAPTKTEIGDILISLIINGQEEEITAREGKRVTAQNVIDQLFLNPECALDEEGQREADKKFNQEVKAIVDACNVARESILHAAPPSLPPPLPIWQKEAT